MPVPSVQRGIENSLMYSSFSFEYIFIKELLEILPRVYFLAIICQRFAVSLPKDYSFLEVSSIFQVFFIQKIGNLYAFFFHKKLECIPFFAWEYSHRISFKVSVHFYKSLDRGVNC